MAEAKTKIQELLYSGAKKIVDPAGREVEVLEDAAAAKLADDFRLPVHEVYKEALGLGIYPHRYLRNREAITVNEQLKLAESQVAVVGAGGLGGHVILLLARLGVGRLKVVDSDVFDESNLNRQALSSGTALGNPKAEEAVKVVCSINPGVLVSSYEMRLTASNAPEIIKDAEVVVDALDNVPDRFVLEEAAYDLGIPMVHGALAGFEGQLMTIFPGDAGLRYLYGNKGASRDKTRSPEAVLGVPTPTPCLVATLQAMEVVKIILNRGRIFRNAMVHVDLETGQLNIFTIKPETTAS